MVVIVSGQLLGKRRGAIGVGIVQYVGQRLNAALKAMLATGVAIVSVRVCVASGRLSPD